MKLLSIFLALAVCTFAAEPLQLSDGRSFQDWSVIGQTGDTVTIKHSKGGTKVKKALLPTSVLARYPITEVPVETPPAPVEKKLSPAEGAKQQHIQDALAAAEKSKASDEAKETARALAHDELVKSRAGMIIRGVGSCFGKIFVLASNVSDGDVALDWQMLRLTPKNGDEEKQFAGVVFDKDDVQDYIVHAHTQRVFLLRQVPEVEAKSVRWADRPDVCPVRQLYRKLSAWDSRDHRADGKIPQRGTALPDDDVSTVLLAASRRYVNAAVPN